MLPIKTQKFQDFYSPAIKSKSLWRLFFGVIIIILVYLGLPFLLGIGVIFLIGPEEGSLVLNTISQGEDPKSVIIILATFIAMFLGVFMAVKFAHNRGLKTLLGPDMKSFGRNFIIAITVVVALTILSLPLLYFFETPVRNLHLTTWLSWMVLGLPLLLLQVSSEELIFRGYLQQQLAARFNSRWIWLVLPALLFGLVHYNPSTMGSNTWLVVANTTVFGLIAADITARTGNLGAAIGLHYANNIFALSVVSMDGHLSGLGLYKTPYHITDEVAVKSALTESLIIFVFIYCAYLFWARNRPEL